MKGFEQKIRFRNYRKRIFFAVKYIFDVTGTMQQSEEDPVEILHLPYLTR